MIDGIREVAEMVKYKVRLGIYLESRCKRVC